MIIMSICDYMVFFFIAVHSSESFPIRILLVTQVRKCSDRKRQIEFLLANQSDQERKVCSNNNVEIDLISNHELIFNSAPII